MNYLPFAGSWFYGTTDAKERAAYTSSWGLLKTAPAEAAWTSIKVKGLDIMSGKFVYVIGESI